MIDPTTIPTDKDLLTPCKVEHIFHPWSHQPVGPPLRVTTASGIRFTTMTT